MTISNGESGSSVRAKINQIETDHTDLETRITALENAPGGGGDAFGYLGGATMAPVGIDQVAVLDPGVFKAQGTVSYTYEWFVDGAQLVGESLSTYTPIAAQENQDLTGRITVTDDNGSEVINLGPLTIIYAAPSLTQSPLADQEYIVGSGTQTVEVSQAFQGGSITYSLTAAPSGVTMPDTATGQLSVTTGVVRQGDVTVRATNSGGFIEDTFNLDVTEPDFVTDPGITAVDSNGWQITHSSPVTYDPIGDPKFLVVSRSGFTESGSPTAFPDYLVLNTRVRQPNVLTLTPDKVAVSDFVYATDTTPGVTNNSTVNAPLPVPMWLNHDWETCLTGTFKAKMTVAHAHAKDQKPVAAVKFIISDGVNPDVEAIVSTMTTKTYTPTGLTAAHFEADMDISSLNQGELTLDVVIYPWVGSAYQASVDGEAYPSRCNWSVLKIYHDSDNTLGRSYAYVDGVGAGTPAVSNDPVTARATPYASITDAANAILAYNTAQYGRSDLSGGYVRLEAGTYVMGSLRATTNVGTGPITLEAADAANRATTIVTDNGGILQNSLPRRTVVNDLTIQRSGTNLRTIFDSNTRSGDPENMLACNRLVFSEPDSTNGNATTMYRTGRTYLMECEVLQDHVTGHATGLGSVATMRFCVGTQNGVANRVHSAVACDFKSVTGQGIVSDPENGDYPEVQGQFFGWNHLHNQTGANTISFQSSNLGANEKNYDDRGFAFVCNVIEHASDSSGAAMFISGDYQMGEVRNSLFTCNTVVGERTNFLYLDGGEDTNPPNDGNYSQYNWLKLAWYKFNIDWKYNTKSDLFAIDPAHAQIDILVTGTQPAELGGAVGNWSQLHKVGFRSNTAIAGSNDGGGHGPGEWLGEIPAWGDVWGTPVAPLAMDFVDDHTEMSGDGTLGEFGDYTPGPASPVSVIPAGLAPYPVDMKGRAIDNDGTAKAGALQPAA